MPANPKSQKIRRVLGVFWLVVLGVMFWNMRAQGFGDWVLMSDDRVTVSQSSSVIDFRPRHDRRSTGLLFFPGALVDPEAYAPLAREIAEAGHSVIIVKTPYRLAPAERHKRIIYNRVLGILRAAEPDRKWVVGGHSVGGALAAEFVARHPGDADGLLLIGTSHPRERDLSDRTLDVTKVYGTEDRLASEEEIVQFSFNLPESTQFVRIDGGNHSQFGWYGWQLGAGKATISRVEQHDKTLEAVLEQLSRIGGG